MPMCIVFSESLSEVCRAEYYVHSIFIIVFPATILRCLSTTTIIMLSINVCIAIIDCSAFALPVF